jgi:hypothetical protein
MDQAIQIFGSILVLVGFVQAQRGRWAPSSSLYLALNFTGSAILAVLAAVEWQLGFLLLESCWAAASGLGLVRSVADRERSVHRSHR